MEARAHLRHLLRLEKRDGFPWNRAKGENISLIKGTYGTLKKGNIFPWKHANRRISSPVSAREGKKSSLKIDPRQLVSGKRHALPSEHIFGSPDAGLPAREAIQRHKPMQFFGKTHPKAGLKAKSNSTIMATFILHSPPIKAVQSISKSELL